MAPRYWDMITHTSHIVLLTSVSPPKLLPLVFDDDNNLFCDVPTSICGAEEQNIVRAFIDSFSEKIEISHGLATRHLRDTI